MKKTNRVLSILLALLLLVLSVPVAFAEGSTYQVGDHIQFGSYPQTKVTDEGIIAALDAAEKTWISYGYYVNGASSDFMKYADIAYNGESYRAVTFSDYRPRWNNDPPFHTCQDTNGYLSNTVYYFKYEPLNWRVLDPATGLVLCEDIVDVQTFNNTYYTDDNYMTYWVDSTKQNYADDYSVSNIRTWLNESFYQTAFTEGQGAAIQTTIVKNNAGATSFADTNDKIFLLSIEDVINTAYGFNSIYYVADAKRQATVTDYAKCQGFDDCWWLRSGDDEGFNGRQHYYGVKSCDAESGNAGYTIAVYCACNGVRPACCLKVDTFEEPITLKDPEVEDVAITAAQSALPENVQIKTTKKEYSVCALKDYDYYKALGYDIIIYSTGYKNPIHYFDNPVLVQLYIPSWIDIDHFVIFHRDSNTGEKREISYTIKEGRIAQFYAHWFSEYGIIDTSSLIGPHEHVYNYKEEITRTPTCITPGERTYTCECGATDVQEIGIDAANHANTETKAAVASTCNVHGCTAGVYCNDCKTWLSGHEEQPFAAHTPGKTVKENEVAATEESGGSYDEVVYCAVCGKELSRTAKTTNPSAPKLNFFQRIIQWFKNLFAKLFGR